MGEESWGILQQEEFTHIWTKTGGKQSKYPGIIICISLEKCDYFISQVLSIYKKFLQHVFFCFFFFFPLWAILISFIQIMQINTY